MTGEDNKDLDTNLKSSIETMWEDRGYAMVTRLTCCGCGRELIDHPHVYSSTNTIECPTCSRVYKFQ